MERVKRIRSKSGLTRKQLLYAGGVALGKSKSQSARDAGYSETMARVPKLQIESAPGLHRAMRQVLGDVGITEEFIAERILEGMGAMSVQAFLDKKTGEIVDRVYVDYRTRGEYVRIACDLMGLYPEKKKGEDGVSSGVTVNLLQVLQSGGAQSEEELLALMQAKRASLLGGGVAREGDVR